MKALLSITWIFLLVIVFGSCDGDDEDFMPPMGPLATIEIGEDTYTSEQYVVIFLSKENGELIEALEVQNGDIIELDRPTNFIEDQFTITIFEARTLSGGVNTYNIWSWRGVNPGSFKRIGNHDFNKLTEANISFQNIPEHNGSLVSSPYRHRSDDNLPEQVRVNVYGPDESLGFVRLNRVSGPAYKVVDALQPGENRAIDLSDLRTDFGSRVISVPGNDYSTIRLELDFFSLANDFNSYRYRVEDIFDSNPPAGLDQVPYAYPEDFLNNDTYDLDIYLHTLFGSSRMNYLGNILPTAFESLSADIDFISTDRTDFQVNVNTIDPYDVMFSSWTYINFGGQGSTSIIVYLIFSAPDDQSYSFPEFPDLIETEFPDFDITNLTLAEVGIYDFSQISSYEENIDLVFRQSGATFRDQPYTLLSKGWKPF